MLRARDLHSWRGILKAGTHPWMYLYSEASPTHVTDDGITKPLLGFGDGPRKSCARRPAGKTHKSWLGPPFSIDSRADQKLIGLDAGYDW